MTYRSVFDSAAVPRLAVLTLTFALFAPTSVYSQTAFTGALTGLTLDRTGAVNPLNSSTPASTIPCLPHLSTFLSGLMIAHIPDWHTFSSEIRSASPERNRRGSFFVTKADEL